MPTEKNDSENNPVADDTAPVPPPRRGRKTATRAIGVIVLVVAGFYGYRMWSFGSTHVSTDDAYLTSNVVIVSPEVSGKVVNVLVRENQEVKKGELIAVLDGVDYQAAISRAEAALAEARRSVEAADANIAYTQATGNGQIQQAEGGIQQAAGNEASIRSQYDKTKAGILSAIAGRAAATANLASAGAGISQAISTLTRARTMSAAASAQVAAAQASLRQTQSALVAAQAVAERTTKNETRYRLLFDEGVVTLSQFEQVSSDAASSRAEVIGAEARIQQAVATVDARRNEAESAQEQIKQAQLQIDTAKAQQTASFQAVNAADAEISSSEAATTAAGEDIASALGKHTEAAGKLLQALTVSGQVKVLQAQRNSAEARIREAEVVLEVARKNLDRTHVLAPVDGLVGKRDVEPGERVEVGTPLIAIVEAGDLWVKANFKETQLQSMVAGQRVDIDVDALSGSFKGHIASLSPGTGAIFSLLPPDNATGNFTKVIQRVPVRIDLEANQPNLDRLRSGLSVKVTVRIKE